jgi:hypothetical protein
MRSRCCAVIVLVQSLSAACSSGGTGGDRRLFVPEGLANTNLDGADVGLVLAAFTLVPGATGPELYAAIRNDDVTPACNGGFVTYFLDKAGQVITSDGAGLEGGGLYQLPDGPVVTCIEPGEIAYAASTDLPDTIVIDALGSLQHQTPYFIIDGIVPLGRLVVSDVEVVTTASGSAFTGTVTNGLATAVSAPAVSVFSLNAVGRPLGVATASATVSVAAGGTWTFETTAVSDPGVATAAAATASLTP